MIEMQKKTPSNGKFPIWNAIVVGAYELADLGASLRTGERNKQTGEKTRIERPTAASTSSFH